MRHAELTRASELIRISPAKGEVFSPGFPPVLKQVLKKGGGSLISGLPWESSAAELNLYEQPEQLVVSGLNEIRQERVLCVKNARGRVERGAKLTE
jgi:hypothetical protein